MGERPTLVYCSSNRAIGFATSIAYANRSFDYEFTGTDDNPFLSLAEADGVVFVGTQTSKTREAVFESYLDYFEFIDEAHEAGLGISAVLNPHTRLPGDNKGIDYVIEAERGERTILSIAEELARYFNTRLSQQ